MLERNSLRNSNSRLHIDKELYKKAKYDTSKLIEEKLSENVGKPKELWESPNSLGMPNKTVISNFNAVEDSNTLTHDNDQFQIFSKTSFQT